jgi:hypothetical protein
MYPALLALEKRRTGQPTRRRRNAITSREEGAMTASKGLRIAAIATISGFALSQPAWSEASDPKLGRVHFETSCSPEAAAAFDRGMLYQHSFWYRASQREYEKALAADTGCGIAHWGIALSLLWNPHAAPPVKNLAEGWKAIEAARAAGAKTERERDYIEALAAMYTNYEISRRR